MKCQSRKLEGGESYRARGYPSLCTGAPTRYKEAECVTCTEGDTSEECPFFALYPVVIPYVVCVGKQRIEGKKWKSIDMGVPRKGEV